MSGATGHNPATVIMSNEVFLTAPCKMFRMLEARDDNHLR
jgi:hypothetical protein